MNIVVCVKQVVDTEAVIALDGAGEVELTGQTMVIDPYSEFAVERAVQLKEELGGTVTLLTLGSQDCLAAVRHVEHLLDLGGDETLALGGDLDGCATLGGGITGVQDYPTLYAALAARGYDSALLQALFSENWLRVLPKS